MNLDSLISQEIYPIRFLSKFYVVFIWKKKNVFPRLCLKENGVHYILCEKNTKKHRHFLKGSINGFKIFFHYLKEEEVF